MRDKEKRPLSVVVKTKASEFGKSFKEMIRNPLAIVLFVFLIAYVLVLFGMLLWAVMTSIKDFDFFRVNTVWFPESFADWDFANYIEAFRQIKQQVTIGGTSYYVFLDEMFINSLIYSIGCAFFATLTPCLVAYVTAKYKSRFNSVLYTIVIVVMVTPIVGALPSQIQMSKLLGLYNNHIGMWFMSATFLGTYYLIFYSVFKGLSWGYAEAAFVDGAGHFTVMTRVMFPLVRNTFLVIFLLNFISRWNDYQTPLIFMPDVATAAVGVHRFADNPLDIPVLFAGCIMLMLPVLILFLIFRNKLIGNLTVGGIKG